MRYEDLVRLLKKYRHQTNLTACAIEFMKMVGADHSPPLEGWQAKPDGVVVACLHQPNRLRHPTRPRY